MIKVFYPTGATIYLENGTRFTVGVETINVFNKDDKLIASFYRLDGMGVVIIKGKEVDKNAI